MILMRHGQTVFNIVFGETRIDPGIEDPHLTDEGRAQALAGAKALAGEGVTRLIASPYTRALQTADIIARELALPLSVEPLARERAAYACDVGTPRSRLAADWAHLALDHLDEQWWSPMEEPPSHFSARCGAFREAMARHADWPRLAVVTHWGVIRELTGKILRNGEFVRVDPTAPGEVLVPLDDPC